MLLRSLFATRLYEAELDDEALLADLAHSIRTLADDDRAGQRWSREHGYKGYTSYASLNDLPKRDPAFADLAKALTRHAAAFAKDCAFDLARKPRLDSLWVNLLKAGWPSHARTSTRTASFPARCMSKCRPAAASSASRTRASPR